MSKHNRERRLLWREGLAKKQAGRKLGHSERKKQIVRAVTRQTSAGNTPVRA